MSTVSQSAPLFPIIGVTSSLPSQHFVAARTTTGVLPRYLYTHTFVLLAHCYALTSSSALDEFLGLSLSHFPSSCSLFLYAL